MISLHGLCCAKSWSGRVLRGAVVIGVLTGFAGSTFAQDRFVVKRDGSKIRVIKSENEFAVSFADSESVDKSARRLASSGYGVIEDIRGTSDSRYKLMRVADTTARRRGLVLQDAAVTEVHPVYYYEGCDSPVLSTGTIAMRTRSDLGAEAKAQLMADYRLALVEDIAGMPGVSCVRPVDDGDDEVLRAEAMTKDSRIVWAQPNFRAPRHTRQTVADDEYYTHQWHLNNTGQDGGTLGADISAPEAWEMGAEGVGILVGMLDDSCDVDHEDLRGNYLGTGNDPSLPSTASGFTDPRPKQLGDSHGTAVMGLAVACANSVGGRGVAYLSRFTASRGLLILSDAETANAYLFARQQEVDVHINSWGLDFGTPIPAILEEALETAFNEGRDTDGEDGDSPPRGMVLLFASGNGVNNFGPGAYLGTDSDLSTLPTVIGVGASNINDSITEYSNYGPDIDVLAPGGDSYGELVTTDNDDDADYVDAGYNIGGFDAYGDPELDAAGLYTDSFMGTSAACPVAAGVAAMILSINPQLTATDVRLILEHTCDKIDPEDADYDGITDRSLRYGYGRINAERAVEAATESLDNGGRTWPERAAQVMLDADNHRITWLRNGDTLEFTEEDDTAEEDPDDEDSDVEILQTVDEYLVLESSGPFDFVPEDGKCYDADQVGCKSAVLENLPANVSVLAIGCGLVCGSAVEGDCEAGEQQCVNYDASGTKYFAIYGRSLIGRYSFGVSLDTDGNVGDNGELPPGKTGDSGSGGSGTTTDPSVGPKVTISVSPLEGTSPLTVYFSGNASSTLPIDESRTAWDFDIDDSVTVDSTSRSDSHTYVVAAGESKTFIARLTMYDTEDNIGYAQTSIRVTGADGTDDSDTVGAADIQIVIGIPGTVGSDIGGGTSPLQVELSIDATDVDGTVQSVLWDLGDGTQTTSLFATHTYVNNTGVELRLPITATVTIASSSGATFTTTASKRITVLPGDDDAIVVEPVCDGCGAEGPGGSASICGAIGMIPMLLGMGSLLWLRRLRW